MAVIIGATLFGALTAMLHEAKKPAAIALTIGVAVSLLSDIAAGTSTIEEADRRARIATSESRSSD